MVEVPTAAQGADEVETSRLLEEAKLSRCADSLEEDRDDSFAVKSAIVDARLPHCTQDDELPGNCFFIRGRPRYRTQDAGDNSCSLKIQHIQCPSSALKQRIRFVALSSANMPLILVNPRANRHEVDVFALCPRFCQNITRERDAPIQASVPFGNDLIRRLNKLSGAARYGRAPVNLNARKHVRIHRGSGARKT